jgi:hypothetical protein
MPFIKFQCFRYDTGLKFLNEGTGLRRKFNHDETTSGSGSSSKKAKGSPTKFTSSINEPRRVLKVADGSTDPSTYDADDALTSESYDTSPPVQVSRTVLGTNHDFNQLFALETLMKIASA